MATYGKTLKVVHDSRFVGREPQQAAFQTWMATSTDAVALLWLSGPGGSGKSWLVRRFSDLARQTGRPVVLVDARSFAATPDGLLGAMGFAVVGQAAARLNQLGALWILDTMELVGPLTRYLQEELLGRLDQGVKVVLSGRHPLPGAWREWRPFVRTMALSGLSRSERRQYLVLRGIEEPALLHQLSDLGGHPLTLSLAADLVADLGVVDLSDCGEWRVSLRALVEEMLSDIVDPELRELLEAASVLRESDQATLAAVTGRFDISEGFARLCQLSMVRPGRRGLMVHDDVRRILVEDLRWRHRERYERLRLCALSHYSERIARAPADEQDWLAGERLHLVQDALARAVSFEAAAADIWVEPAGAGDRETVLDLQREFGRKPSIGSPPPERSAAFLADVLDCPAATVVLARDANRQALGYGFVLELVAESTTLVSADAVMAATVRACLAAVGSEPPLVRPDRDQGPVFYLSSLVVTRDAPEAAIGALVDDACRLLAREGVYLALTANRRYQRALAAFGFDRVPAGDHQEPGGQHFQAFVLDLRSVGFQAWVESMVAERPLSTAARPGPGGREIPTAPGDGQVAVPGPLGPVPSIQVRTLGGFEVLVDGIPQAIVPGLATQVLKLVSVTGSVRIDELVEELWPSARPGAGRTRLRNVLNRLRSSYGALVVRDAEVLRLTHGVTVDAVEFDRRTTELEWARLAKGSAGAEVAALASEALVSYRGELLPDDRLAEWTAAPRERLARRHLMVIDLLAEQAAAAGHTDEALRHLEAAMELERFDEQRYVLAARLLIGQGRMARAAVVLGRARGVAKELGVRASPAVTALEAELSAPATPDA